MYLLEGASEEGGVGAAVVGGGGGVEEGAGVAEGALLHGEGHVGGPQPYVEADC